MTYSAASEIPVYGTVTLLANVYFDGTPNYGGLWANTTWGGWGPWLNSSGAEVGDPEVNTWVSTRVLKYTFTESNPLTKYGVCECGQKAPMYCYSVSVYLKPSNAFWMLDAEGNRELIVATEDTYTLPTEYNGAIVTKWTDGTQLYDAGTILEKASMGGKTFEPVNAVAAPVPEAYDPTYGKLLYFNNFVDEPVNTLLNLSVEKAGVLTVKNGYYCVPGQNQFFTEWFDTAVSGIELTAGKDANGIYNDWTYTNGEKVTGILRIVAEVWGTDSRSVNDVFYNGYKTYHGAWDAGYTELRTSWDSKKTQTDTWMTYSPKVAAAQDCFKRWGVGSIGAGNDKLYFRSIAIYDSNPDNVFWMVNISDGTKEYVEMTGDSYTLPTEYKGITVESWTDGTNQYAAGADVSKAELAGKMLSPFFGAAPAPANYHSESGQLLYYNNFKDTPVGNLVDLSVEWAGELSTKGGYYCVSGKNAGYFGFGATGLYGVALCKKDGEGNYTDWTYGDGTTVSGKLRIVAEVYTDEDCGMWDAFVNGKEDYGGPWSGLVRSAWGNQLAVGGTWTTVTPENTYKVGNFQRWGLSNTENEKIPYYRSIAIYATAPDNAFWTISALGENRTYLVISGDTYTLPNTCGTERIAAWTDGTKEYMAGGEYAKAELAGKTLTAIGVKAPKTETGVEMRLSGNNSTSGIRFKASVFPSDKACADEIGFIAARKDVLDELGADLTFDIKADGVENPEGKLYVKGIAYSKAENKDIVYGANEDGSEIYAAACVGMNIANKNQVTSILVTRPYLKMTVGEKQVTLYGETNSSSLADTVSSLMTEVEAGDEAAILAYNSAKTYIDTIIATANAE